MKFQFESTDKNFLVRLKAAIDKRLTESGLLKLALNGSKDYDEYEKTQAKFFGSLADMVTTPSLSDVEVENTLKEIINRHHGGLTEDDMPMFNEIVSFIAGYKSALTQNK